MRISKKVLIVDDDEYVCEVLSFAVKKAGAKPVVFLSSKKALKSFYHKDNHFCLAILDLLFINDLDGISLGERMFEKRPSMPIVLCTGYPVDDVPEMRARVARFGEHLDKPIDMRPVVDFVVAKIKRINFSLD